MKKSNLLLLLPLALLSSCNSDATYTITFVDEGNNVLQTGLVKRGEMPTYNGEIPTKKTTAKYTYTFAGWDPEIKKAKKDATYTVVFTSTIRQYLIEFLDYDYSVLLSEHYDYGTVLTAPTNVTQSYEDQYYTYTFKDWGGNLRNVTGDRVYIATYTQTRK